MRFAVYKFKKVIIFYSNWIELAQVKVHWFTVYVNGVQT
jgi:hypothetical protein